MSLIRLSRVRQPQRILVFVLLLALFAALAGAAGGCRPADEGPIEVTDDAGREVELSRPIDRIVSLAPSNTEVLYAVGAGDKVVGVDEFSNYPAETADVAKVGGYSDVNVEAVVALEADLILASTIHQEQVEQLEGLGLKVLVFEPRTFDDVYENIKLVGQLAGQTDLADQVVAGMQDKVAAVEAKIADVAVDNQPLVFYEVWDDPLMSAGPDTYTHQIIELAGGRNLTADATADYPVIGYELVVARDPHVIVFPTFHGSEPLTIERLNQRPGWSNLAAVREGRLAGINADIMARGGPRLADAVTELAKILYPEMFE